MLDFGLAKLAQASDYALQASGPAALSQSPTITSPAMLTGVGVLLGTAAYMSPEQARGKAIDRRSDIWAFGCVLYEMLTGRRAFDGEEVSDVLAATLMKAPALEALPPGTPGSIRRLLRRALDKDRTRRLESAADARLEIDDAMRAAPLEIEVARVAGGHRRGRHLVLSGVAVAALAVAGALAWRDVPREQPSVLYVSIDAPPGTVLGEDDQFASLPMRTPMVFTPDGRSLVIQAARDGRPQLFLRSLDAPDARPIPGTEGAHVPFVSPDGKWIGFWAANELRKVPVGGQTATTIAPVVEAIASNGAAWGVDNTIVFGDERSGRLMRVSANGGAPVALTEPPQTGRLHVAPMFLPDGRRLLFSDVSVLDAGDSRVMVQALDGGDARMVVESATDGRLLPSGQLAFMRAGTLMTVGVDLARAEATGDAVAVMGQVMQSGLRGRGRREHRRRHVRGVESRHIGGNPGCIDWRT